MYRIRVEFDTGKRILIPIQPNKTIGELAAQAVPSSADPKQFSFFLPDGTELRLKDEVCNVLDSGDLVQARYNGMDMNNSETIAKPSLSTNMASFDDPDPLTLLPVASGVSPGTARKAVPEDHEDDFPRLCDQGDRKRVVIAFRSAELARNHGRDQPIHKLGFGGSAVSVKLTMDVVRREASIALGWAGDEDDAMSINQYTDGEDSMRGTCSCTLANRIANGGIFQYLHCRKEIDGSHCGVEECTYSHTHITSDLFASSVSDLQCAICTELLGFPCERCLSNPENQGKSPADIFFCALVQNAGCKHLFHAHCYFSQQGSSKCPAGCPEAYIFKEPYDFSAERPHLLVIHSGSWVEKVELPQEFLPGDLLTLLESQVLEIIRARFNGHKGLTVHMFGRKADGLLQFRGSTLVSVCCSTRHTTKDAIVRQILSPLPSEPKYQASLDLHTVSSPIFNEDPGQTIEGLGLDQGIENGGQLLLFVVRRAHMNEGEPDIIDKGVLYSNNSCWLPAVSQSDRGMAAYLSSLLVFCHILRNYDDEGKQKRRMMTYFMTLTRFPPAVRTLHLLMKNDTPAPQERRALSEAFYHLCLDLPPPFAIGNIQRVFEASRIVLGTILGRCQSGVFLPSLNVTVNEVDLCKEVNLCCELTGERLRYPVVLADKIVERQAAVNQQAPGPLYDPSASPIAITGVSKELAALVAQASRAVSSLIIFDSEIILPVPLARNLSQEFDVAVRATNSTELKIYAPLSIRQQAVTPSLSLDDVGFNTVYFSRGGACGTQDTIFLRPCHGGEKIVDVNLVAARLDPIIPQRKLNGEWTVDAFADSGDHLDARPVEEAIVICLDLSRSMETPFETQDDVPDSRVNGDQIALLALTSSYDEHLSDDELFSTASEMLTSLDCLPNIVRLVPNRDSDIAGARSMAGQVLDELVVLYTRAHHVHFGSRRRGATDMLTKYIHFVVAMEKSEVKTRLVAHLLDLLDTARTSPLQPTYRSEPPRAYLCPLSGKLMSTPVRASDGQIYDRDSFASWRSVNSQSPMLPNVVLEACPCVLGSLQEAISNWRANHTLAPSFRVEPVVLEIKFFVGSITYVSLIRNPSVLAVLFDLWKFRNIKPRSVELWHNLKDSGDGHRHGTRLSFDGNLDDFCVPSRSDLVPESDMPVARYSLEYLRWRYRPNKTEEQTRRSKYMTRLDVAKQAFEAFVNKLQAFDMPIALGLVSFGRTVAIRQEITMIKENFRDRVRDVEADGDTPLMDSLSVAQNILSQYHTQHPSARLRILCLTDGVDVGSVAQPHLVCSKLQRVAIKLDAINFQGPSHDLDLHAIAVATGGYSFRVDTVENALAIVELETVLASKDRVDRPHRGIVFSPFGLAQYRREPMDEVTVYSFPQRRPHTRLENSVVRAQKKVATTMIPTTVGRTKRLMDELRQVVNLPHPAIDVYTCDEDIGFWKAVVQAPEGSPYAGGCFLLYVDFPSDYPQKPPEVRFVTKILHPNINRHGKVCHAALDRSWVASMSMITIFQVIFGLLLTPDTDNPLDLHATMQYNDDTGQHALKLNEMVQLFAGKTREQWRLELDP